MNIETTAIPRNGILQLNLRAPLSFWIEIDISYPPVKTNINFPGMLRMFKARFSVFNAPLGSNEWVAFFLKRFSSRQVVRFDYGKIIL